MVSFYHSWLAYCYGALRSGEPRLGVARLYCSWLACGAPSGSLSAQIHFSRCYLMPEGM